MRKGVDNNAMFDVVLSFFCVDACGQSCCSGGVTEDGCGLLRCELLSWAIGGAPDK